MLSSHLLLSQGIATAHPAPPIPFDVWATSPDGQHEQKLVLMEGRSARDLFFAAKRQLVQSVEDLPQLCFMEEVFYRRGDEERLAWACSDGLDGVVLLDADNGKRVRTQDLGKSFLRFLHPSSPLPTGSTRPLAYMRTQADLFTLGSQHSPSPARAGALTNTSFLVFLRGVRSEQQFFFEFQGPCFFNAEAGQFQGQEELPGVKRHFLLLLEESPVPQLPLPSQGSMLLFARSGAELVIVDGAIRCEKSPTDRERWVRLGPEDEFYAEFFASLDTKASQFAD